MSRRDDTRYSFETQPTRHTLRRARDMVEKLLLRLGTPDPGPELERLSDGDRRSLMAFATNCHLNIDWYARSRKRQRRLYWIFGAFTGVLVLAMPVAIFFTHSRASDALAGQIGVIITGVLSAHRALASTLEKRNMERHFWKAQADLKSILYSFEDKWRGCALADPGPADAAPLRFADGLIKDLQKLTRSAQDVKNQEQEQFFSQVSTPFTGIAEMLGVVGSSGSTFLESSRQRKRQRANEVNKVNEMEVTERALQAQLDDLESQLEALEGATEARDIARRKAVQSAADKLQSRLLSHQIELEVARSKLNIST